MSLFARAFALVVLLALTRCTSNNEPDLKAEEARIMALYPGWVKQAQETRNPDDYFAGVTDDFVIMGCDFDPITSIDSIRSGVGKMLDSDVIVGIEDCRTYEIIIRDDIAIHRYSCVEVITSRSDTTKRKEGYNYLDILQKTKDNTWKIHLHLGTERP